jgi:hypothetical protein
MRRAAATLLALWILALGSGLVECVHELQHEMEDRVEDARAAAAGKPLEGHEHDETNCSVHLQLHLPLLQVPWVPAIAVFLAVIAVVDVVGARCASAGFVERKRCRDPPRGAWAAEVSL